MECSELAPLCSISQLHEYPVSVEFNNLKMYIAGLRYSVSPEFGYVLAAPQEVCSKVWAVSTFQKQAHQVDSPGKVNYFYLVLKQ
jgi:hypothetical protein